MKKHQILGNARCICCGGPTCNATPVLCLPCLIEMNGQKVVAFALDARFHVNSRFSGPMLLAFAEKYPGIYGVIRSILNLNPIFIKACEQAQQDIQTIEASRDICDVSPTTRQPKKSAKSRQRKLREKQNQLLAQLITEQDGLCPYCASPLTLETAHLDTILPTGFNHTKIGLTTKVIYFQTAARAGNLAAACVMCNWRKGQAEQRGAQIMRLIASGNYPAQPVKSTDLSSTRQPRIYFAPEELPGKKRGAYTPAECEILKQAIECFALRVTYPCPHRPDWLFARWMEEARTLIFGCEQCVPSASAILAVDVRSKNWMRTERQLHRRAEPGVLILDRTLLRRCPVERFFEFMEKKLQHSMGELREIRMPVRELQRRPAHELAFESQKMLHDKFPQHFAQPGDAVADFYKARAAEADAHFMVAFGA